MGHCINYITADRNASKDAILAGIREEVMHENWGEGGSYHGHLRWHDSKIYADRQEAEEAIDRLDNGWYDDHAVLFRDCGKLENATTKRLAKQIHDARDKKRAYIESNHVTSRKSAYIGCPRCGSKLSREHLRSDFCPLCHADLRSETVRSRIDGYDAKVEEWEKKLREEKKKLSAKAPVKWLVKYEYHV